MKQNDCRTCKHKKYDKAQKLYFCRNEDCQYCGEHMEKEEWIDFCDYWEGKEVRKD